MHLALRRLVTAQANSGPLRLAVTLVIPAMIVSISCSSAVPPTDSAAQPVDRVFVEKSRRTLTLYSGAQIVKSYEVALGKHPEGRKGKQGDARTPEGHYVIDRRNANSGFHRALHVSYPNEDDRARALKANVDPGGDIMIHGIKNGLGAIGRLHRLRDWTNGCIAVTNKEIEEIWDLVPDGTAVEIVP